MLNYHTNSVVALERNYRLQHPPRRLVVDMIVLSFHLFIEVFLGF